MGQHDNFKKLVDTMLEDGYNSIKHIKLIKLQGIKREESRWGKDTTKT